MSILKPQNSMSWVGGITNEIMRLSKGLFEVKLNPIKPMFAVFANTQKSYVATF